jgi:hypothetical protein
MKRFVPNGRKQFAFGGVEDIPDAFEFVEGEVYDVNILMSTGKGETKPTEGHPTVYKRDLGVRYSLRAQVSRQVREYTIRDMRARERTPPPRLTHRGAPSTLPPIAGIHGHLEAVPDHAVFCSAAGDDSRVAGVEGERWARAGGAVSVGF